jgi:hypothetical protein
MEAVNVASVRRETIALTLRQQEWSFTSYLRRICIMVRVQGINIAETQAETIISSTPYPQMCTFLPVC